ncbi:flagellar hook-basal body complex protein FliE [Anaerosalibacter bizertensis]|uniref:Flagellar hook-basal body complex protein FliE n=1 Tax=Anaerosalibacter bizertensis TaxID=932217 RepID=A0A9Q4A9W9_9FIRM|nr:flagellar hook-basal body complex protein FliE [Anaerosalibacter bizertensis]MBV1816557.1 flagellar hook-basal body complex protein FliE [Bacteroidales bacterium MSK.15.36]HHV27229.1 flagellar hook-basal body complex protein FliE [Tissierellia bacterium]MBU5293303.1 flagellar hook-basal body complex protein FliE [Anaerosalibacter bizertensis]MCB5558639.1 flagellar hook-basal body complex protein FliE [Anaerosalibacter bizertensis]MCG4563944.1 flagellar hook-basal body complex protein FliE [
MNINPINYEEDNFSILANNNEKKQSNSLSFGTYLKEAINDVNKLQIESENYKKLLATGDVDNLHDVMIAAEKADISLQLTMSIRNKVVDAYREIMRMQL